MELREFLTDCFTSTCQRVLGAVKELTPTQLHWQPTPDTNHVAFLAFHVFRVYDRHLHRFLSPQGELWERNKCTCSSPCPPPHPTPPSFGPRGAPGLPRRLPGSARPWTGSWPMGTPCTRVGCANWPRWTWTTWITPSTSPPSGSRPVSSCSGSARIPHSTRDRSNT
ncbi:MAG: DinB family protein [SAR202 cluster bacterium]|nr:DinB family protein [SAR202 cluster bacterium]